MTYLPVLSPLPRLDVPVKSKAWRAWHALLSPEERREKIHNLMTNEDVAENERLRRMRTLIDIGLWGDHRTETSLDDDVRYLGYHVLLSQRSDLCTPEMLHLALEAGVSPEWREGNKFNDTLFTLAIRNHFFDYVQVLMDAGVNPKMQDSCSKTPLHLLLQIAINQEEDSDKALTCADALLNAGIDINDPGEYGLTPIGSSPPIAMVVRAGRKDLIEWMINRGARLDVCDHGGDTPLHWVSDIENNWKKVPLEDVLEILLKAGAKIDQENKRGETPLWTALAWGRQDIAAWCIENGARIDHRPHTYQDNDGYEHPDHTGKSMLELLVNKIPFSDEAVELAHALSPNGLADWKTNTSSGEILYDVLEDNQSPWRVAAQYQAMKIESAKIPVNERSINRPRL